MQSLQFRKWKKEEENLYYSKLEMMKNLFLCVWTPDVLFNINYVRVIALFVDTASWVYTVHCNTLSV